jgi:hypothetical protein
MSTMASVDDLSPLLATHWGDPDAIDEGGISVPLAKPTMLKDMANRVGRIPDFCMNGLRDSLRHHALHLPRDEHGATLEFRRIVSATILKRYDEEKAGK